MSLEQTITLEETAPFFIVEKGERTYSMVQTAKISQPGKVNFITFSKPLILDLDIKEISTRGIILAAKYPLERQPLIYALDTLRKMALIGTFDYFGLETHGGNCAWHAPLNNTESLTYFYPRFFRKARH